MNINGIRRPLMDPQKATCLHKRDERAWARSSTAPSRTNNYGHRWFVVSVEHSRTRAACEWYICRFPAVIIPCDIFLIDFHHFTHKNAPHASTQDSLWKWVTPPVGPD